MTDSKGKAVMKIEMHYGKLIPTQDFRGLKRKISFRAVASAQDCQIKKICSQTHLKK